jgi:hypothetical protein
MRRRTWSFLIMLDVFFSHQVSLPSMISEDDCDTELPHNIYDEEFGPETTALPPDRPNTEPTPVSYLVAKVKLCQQLGIILQATGRVKNQAHYDEILRLDAQLRDIRAGLPPHLRMQPLDGSQDPLTLVMRRFHLDSLYLKLLCLLHRKYMPRARHNPRYVHSRRTAIEASLESLRHLATLHRESQPSGRLHSVKWFFKSVATKDFLLPAVLIVVDLHYDNVSQRSTAQQDGQGLYFWSRAQRQEMIDSLELTRDIWKGIADISMEAVKAFNIIEVMLAKIKNSGGADGPTNPLERPVGAASLGPGVPADLPPEHSAAMTLGMLFGGAIYRPSAAFGQTSMGTTYGAPNLGSDTANAGSNPGTGPGIGSATAPDFSNPMLGFDGAQSPLSMFDNMASSNMNFTDGFDWVRMLPRPFPPLDSLPWPVSLLTRCTQDTFENYTQTANWAGESIQFFPGNPEQPQEQAQPDGAQFPYGADLTGAS